MTETLGFLISRLFNSMCARFTRFGSPCRILAVPLAIIQYYTPSVSAPYGAFPPPMRAVLELPDFSDIGSHCIFKIEALLSGSRFSGSFDFQIDHGGIIS